MNTYSRKEHTNTTLYKNTLFSDLMNDLCKNAYVNGSGELISTMHCDRIYEGYAGIMNGGILSALVDAAMTECLFRHGITAYTSRLNLKFKGKIYTGEHIDIVTKLVSVESPVAELKTFIYQHNRKKLTASARFWIFDEQ